MRKQGLAGRRVGYWYWLTTGTDWFVRPRDTLLGVIYLWSLRFSRFYYTHSKLIRWSQTCRMDFFGYFLLDMNTTFEFSKQDSGTSSPRYLNICVLFASCSSILANPHVFNVQCLQNCHWLGLRRHGQAPRSLYPWDLDYRCNPLHVGVLDSSVVSV